MFHCLVKLNNKNIISILKKLFFTHIEMEIEGDGGEGVDQIKTYTKLK